jgi:hypothetical protein
LRTGAPPREKVSSWLVRSQARPGGRCRAGLLHGQRDVAQDRDEDVVEVVRDAPGEDADRLELLRLQQLLLDPLLVGDVAEHDDHALERAVLPSYGGRARRDASHPA